ncbi:ABC transporter permease [Bosea lathyri]|uniref:Arginine/ornithine transport system permease protein n=1 Tax=Bosea lathyri TaxID=1036778 RepID=A0A1H6CYR8_9HYPH|nr:ABC transporter permease subunit [Bosea lathyri]SEG78221.1 arginine/ornithine transport system permease protein [Bosea lathyri]
MLAAYAMTVLGAGLVTLQLAAGALALAVLFGLAGALCKLSSSVVLRTLAGIYTSVVRGIPDLVLMLLVFYSLPTLVNEVLTAAGISYYFELDPFIAGTVTLALIFGAYMTETFRGALVAIPKGQVEAARAYGLGPMRTFTGILLPQMARLALPGFTNNWLVLLKATALASLIGLQDVMLTAKGAAEATGQPFTFYLLAGGFYLALTLSSVLFLAWLGRRLDLGTRELSR